MSGREPFLERLVQAFEKADIPYMISGSIASSFHGHPRATNDIDIIIDPTFSQLQTFLDTLDAQWYVSKEAAKQARIDRQMFNIIDIQSGQKADLIIRKSAPFYQQEFSRRFRADVLGVRAYILSSEDSILSKLAWAKETGSEYQLKDIMGILTVQGDKLDMDYLRAWAKQLGVDQTLKTLIWEAEKLK